MDKINEVQVLTNVRLSQAQKFVLAKLKLPDATPLTSYEFVSKGKNVVANRDILVKLGMIEVGQNEAQITDKGEEALRNENLTDEAGNLTPQGEKYAYAEDLEAVGEIAAQQQQDQPSPEMGNVAPPTEEPALAPDPLSGSTNGTPSLESWKMISAAQAELSEKQFMKKHKL